MPVWGGAQRGPEHAAAGLSVCPTDLRLALHKRYRLQPPSWSKTLPAPDPPLTHRLEDDHGRQRAHRTLQKGSRIWAFMGPRDVVPLGDNRPRVTELTGRHLGVLARREHGGRGPRRRRKELVALTDGTGSPPSPGPVCCETAGAAGCRPGSGDGRRRAGFSAALRDVFPETREQRCWFHMSANVLAALPKSAHPGAIKAMQRSTAPKTS